MLSASKQDEKKHSVLRRWERYQKRPLDLLHISFEPEPETNPASEQAGIPLCQGAPTLARIHWALVLSPEIHPDESRYPPRDAEEPYQAISLCDKAQVGALRNLYSFLISAGSPVRSRQKLEAEGIALAFLNFDSLPQTYGLTGGYAGDAFNNPRQNLYGLTGRESRISVPVLPKARVWSQQDNQKVNISHLYPLPRKEKPQGIHISIKIG